MSKSRTNSSSSLLRPDVLSSFSHSETSATPPALLKHLQKLAKGTPSEYIDQGTPKSSLKSGSMKFRSSSIIQNNVKRSNKHQKREITRQKRKSTGGFRGQG